MVRDVVDDAMTSLGNPAYRMGGGTILAARWEHRESFDVDLTLPADTALGSLRAEHGDSSGFEARLKALGGAPTYYPDLKLWRVAFDEGERGLDLWAHEPEIGSGEEQRTVHGKVETVLSSTQILRGKLERADKRLPRDVFDMAKAAGKAAAALESAVNAVSAERAEHIAHDWYWNGADIANEARRKLDGVPDKEHVDPNKLGNVAAQAITRAIYTHCRIATRDGAIEVTTATKARKAHKSRIAASKAPDTFEASGLNSYLDITGPGARRLREYALTECRRGRNVLVLNIEPEQPLQWRTENAGANLSPGNALHGIGERPPKGAQQRARDGWKRS